MTFLTQKSHLPRTIQTEVAGPHCQGFADPGTRVVEEQEKRMITAATWRTGFDCSNHGPGLVWLEVCDRSVSRTFGPNGQYAPIRAGARYIVLQKVLTSSRSRSAIVLCLWPAKNWKNSFSASR